MRLKDRGLRERARYLFSSLGGPEVGKLQWVNMFIVVTSTLVLTIC